MKTDARVRYTQRVIRENFIELLKEKPINRITVKEICERSEINRATFYHHYLDAFNLLEHLENEMLNNLQKTLKKENFSDMISFYKHVLIPMKENGEEYHVISNARGDNSFSVRIFLSCYRQIFPNLSSHLGNLDETRQQLLFHYLAQGNSGVISYWFRSGMKESIDTIANFLNDTTMVMCNYFSE